jgi:gas vesicle protein
LSEQNFGLGKGITITTGFDLAAQLPLDSRTVVHDIDQLRALPSDRVFLGLLVFVISENKLYQWKYNLDDDGVLSEEPSWGPIEAEVSAKEIDDLSKIDFVNTPSLQLEKNKNNFFPIVHEKFVYDDKIMALPDKYQTKIDNTLNTIDKSIVGSVNELNTKMDDTIEEFRKQIQDTIDNLNKSVEDMQNQTAADMAKMKADLQKEIDAMLAELNRKSQEMDKAFDDLLADINQQIAELQNKIQDDIDKMLQDVDNVILSDLQVDELMRRININIATIDSY